jgi:hypothetical protein
MVAATDVAGPPHSGHFEPNVDFDGGELAPVGRTPAKALPAIPGRRRLIVGHSGNICRPLDVLLNKQRRPRKKGSA